MGRAARCSGIIFVTIDAWHHSKTASSFRGDSRDILECPGSGIRFVTITPIFGQKSTSYDWAICTCCCSIYIDVHYISTPYGRYIDVAFTVVSCKEETKRMFDTISEQDPDARLKWIIDIQDSSSEFTAFLGTSIKVENGEVSYKYYRKTQKKNITLHYKSHQPLKTKVEVVKNFYKTVEDSSSSSELKDESFKIVCYILLCNGYSDP